MKLLIYGSGGFAKEVATIIKDLGRYDDFVGFVVRAEDAGKETIMGKPLLNEDTITPDGDTECVMGFGDPRLREKVVNGLPPGMRFATLIHPTAVVSEWVTLGEGSVVCAQCVLTVDIQIGKHAQINVGSTVGHDCVIGDYFTTATRASVSGSCVIGDRVYFGVGAATRQGLTVADDVTLGMGGMAVKHLRKANYTYFGVPARPIMAK